MQQAHWLGCQASGLLLVSLLGCAAPPVPSAPVPADAYLQSARLALASYFEADASLADSQQLAGQHFVTSQLPASLDPLVPELPDGPGPAEPGTEPVQTGPGTASPVPTEAGGPAAADPAEGKVDGNDLELPGLPVDSALRPESIDELVGSAPASFARFDGTRSRFNRAAADFNVRLLGAEGLELDASGGILVNPFRLRAQLRAALHANPDLSEPSLDLAGRLLPDQTEIAPRNLAGMGYLATASDVLTLADGAESLLLSYRHQDSGRSHRVRVTRRAQGLSLRLAGLGRLGLRQVADASLSTELTLTPAGLSIELMEQRFVNASGAGAGFGSFVIRNGAMRYSGSLRSLSASDGRLMLMLEPDSLTLGRLLMQQTGPGRVRLSRYDAEGALIAASEIPIAAALAPSPLASEPAEPAS